MRRMTTLSSMMFPRSGLSRLGVISSRSARCCFTFTTIDFPGALATAAFGINDPGHIVGAYVDTAGMEHGFLLAHRRFCTIDVPGAVLTSAFGINSPGHIVGLYTDATGMTHGFKATPCHKDDDDDEDGGNNRPGSLAP